MLEYFDKATKPVFKDEKEPSYIRFGAMSCNDPKVNIKRGQLMLSGWVHSIRQHIGPGAHAYFRSEMSGFFSPSLSAIVSVIQKQRQTTSRSLKVSCRWVRISEAQSADGDASVCLLVQVFL